MSDSVRSINMDYTNGHRQKMKRYTRKHLRNLPAHRRKEEKKTYGQR